MSSISNNKSRPTKWSYQGLLALGALGVVYGDIGTSPLYAVREAFHQAGGVTVSSSHVLGVLSLIFWSLIIIISVKYIGFILKADNNGEGGILSLTALIGTDHHHEAKGPRKLLILLGLFGTALLYGDGMITPAVTVLSAVEGLEIITPIFSPYIIPITLVIIFFLFSVQKLGTGKVGRVFGPITLVWFICLAIAGVYQISLQPQVLGAINPLVGLSFLAEDFSKGFLVLGAVFLVVTGGEALYSDLGHFGRGPIRLAWFTVVLPSLLMNYFGQGALLLRRPEAIDNPFFLMVPSWGLVPMVMLATAASVIASQALITGVYSITMQAVQLGYSPRVRIYHTNREEMGQIYVDDINFPLMISCMALVLFFKSSSALAGAYGVAVTMTMAITTLLFSFLTFKKWKWHPLLVILLGGCFLLVDLIFLGANLTKIFDGGWVPLGVGLFIFTLMTTWKRGRQLLFSRLQEKVPPLDQFLKKAAESELPRVPGVAVFMSGNPNYTPPALAQGVAHFHVLHECIVFLSVYTDKVPHVPVSKRAVIQELGAQSFAIHLHYGFMETPNIPKALAGLKLGNIEINPDQVSYFLGRENLVATDRPGMALWREKLFVVMSRNTQPATSFFHLPSNQVVEFGTIVEL